MTGRRTSVSRTEDSQTSAQGSPARPAIQHDIRQPDESHFAKSRINCGVTIWPSDAPLCSTPFPQGRW